MTMTPPPLPGYNGDDGLDQEREVFIPESSSSTTKIRKKSVRFDLTSKRKTPFLEYDGKRKNTESFLQSCRKSQHNRSIWKIAIVVCAAISSVQIASRVSVQRRMISAAIKHDYSSIKGLDELKMRNDQISIEDRCYVSGSTFVGIVLDLVIQVRI
jgi:hypothetical protein